MNEIELSEYLAAEAIGLTSLYFRLPIPIGRLSYEQGMIIERRHGVGEFKAYMTLPERPDDWAKVILPHRRLANSSVRVTAYDRFCVAHELAHLLVFRKAGFIPLGDKTYWKHEAICDDFARNVLVPWKFVDSLPPVGSLSDVDKVRINANVPWMAAAKQIANRLGHLYFFIVKVSADTESHFSILSSSMHNNKARGSRIGGLLAVKFAKMLAGGGTYGEWKLGGDTIFRSNMKWVNRDLYYTVSLQKDEEFGERCFLSIGEED